MGVFSQLIEERLRTNLKALLGILDVNRNAMTQGFLIVAGFNGNGARIGVNEQAYEIRIVQALQHLFVNTDSVALEVDQDARD